ncbi:hypothetical protein [Hydrogenophaga sp. BPS33]|uniref:hypothetical protein n=1 Tax=Hydrogenophaga sp. BPS33 TaxID=2651974 RepID=UPI00131F75E2|nr:hypothetical protein [Hydrogenophaga sp. BPS33]QHE87170.1 hypothetical protein F9K07_20830 [Hydrogenophaga sp. BPS33]
MVPPVQLVGLPPRIRGHYCTVGAGVAAVAGAGGSSGGSTPPAAPAPAPISPPAPAPQPEPEPTETVHQLTTGLDNVKRCGVDRIIGSSTTFQPADVVNGGEGIDTLQLQLTGGTYGDGAIVSNIEALDVRALAGDSGAVNLYLTDWDDSLAKLNIIEAKQDVAVRDQQTLADVSITKSSKNVALAYEPNVTAGEDDELNVSVNAFKGGLTIDDQVEGVRLSVDDDAGSPNASNMSINALSSTTIVGGRSGQGFGLTLTGEDGSAASLDSSEFVGNLTLNAGSNLKTLTTGAGDDVVTSTSGIYQSDAVYDLGQGNNSLNVSGTVGGSVNAGAGNDTISISGSVNEGASIDMGAGSNTLTAGVVEGSITSGAGADSITVDGIEGNAVVSLGDGDNEVIVGAHGIGEGASLTLGDGNNSVHTTGGVNGVVGEDSETGVSITFGDGNNSFLVATEFDGEDVPVGGAGVGHANIVFGDGDNRMDVATQVVNSSVTFGDGDNILQVVEDVRDSSVSSGDGQNAVLIRSDLEGSSVSFGSGDGNVLATGNDVFESTITFENGNENELTVYGGVADSSTSFGAGSGNVMYVGEDLSDSTVAFGAGEDNMLLVSGGAHNTSVSFAGGSADANIAGQVTSGDGVVSEFSFAGDGNTMDVNAFGGEDSNGIEGHELTTIVGEDMVIEEVRVNVDFGAGGNNTLLVRNGSVQLADISFGEGSANNVGIDKNLQQSSVTFGGEDSTGGAGNGLYVGNDIRNSQVAFFGAASTVEVGDDVTASQLSFGAGANRVEISDDLEDGSSISMIGGGSRIYVGGDVEGSSISIAGGGNSGQMAAVGEDAPDDAGVFVLGDVDASSITVGGGNNIVYVGEDVNESAISLTGEAGEDTLSVGDDIVESTVSFAGAGNVLSVGDDVEGSSLSFAAGGNTVTIGGDVEEESEITLAGGGSVVSIGDDLDNSTVALGDGGNSVNVGGELDDGALISATGGDNTVVVGGKVSDGSQINLGGGADTVTVGSNEHKQGSVGGDGGQAARIDVGAGDDQVTLIGSKHYGNTLVRSGGALEGGQGNDTLTIKATSDVNVVGRTEHQELSVELAESYDVGDVVTLKVGEEEFTHTVEYTTAQVLEFTFGGSYSYSANQTYSVTVGGETYSFLFPGAQGGPGAAAQAVADGIKAAIDSADPSIEGFGSINVVAGEVEGTYTLSLTGTSADAENVDASSSHSAAAGADGADRTVQTAEEVASALEALVDCESTTFSASIVDGKIVLTGNGCAIAADVSASLWLNEAEVDGAITTEQLADASISGFETLKLEILNNVGEDTGLTAREITADFSYISGVQNIVLDSQVKIDAVTVVDVIGEQELVNGAYERTDEYADNCDIDGTTEFNLLNLKGGEAITVRGHEVTATGSKQVDGIQIGDQDGDHHVGDVISVSLGGQTYSMVITPEDLDGESAVADANAIATRLAGILQEANNEDWPFSVAVDGRHITLIGTDSSLSTEISVSHTRPNASPSPLYGSEGSFEDRIDFNCLDSIQTGDVISLQVGEELITYTVLQEDLDACCDRHIGDVIAEKVAAAVNGAGNTGVRAFFGVVTLGGELEASWSVTRMESSYVNKTFAEFVQASDAEDDSDIDVTAKATLAENTDNDTMDLTVDGYGAFDLEIVGDGVGQYEHLDLNVVDEFSHYINTNGHQGNFSESIVLTGGAAGASIYLDNIRAADVNSTSEANLTVEQYDTDLQNALVGEDAVVNVSTGSGDDHLITNAWALVNEGSSVDLGTGKNTLSLGWGWVEDCGDAVPRTIAGADLARVSEIEGLTQLHRLNMLNGVVLGEDATLSMMETSVPNTVEEIDLWAVTVTGEDIDLTISGTAASLLLEASEGDLDLQDTGVLTAVGVTDLSVRGLGDVTFALGNDALNTLSVVSRDDEASVYVRDGVNRTVTIGEASLEGRGDDAKFTIRDNTDGSVTVGSLSAEADSDARLAIYDNTNTDISVGALGGVTLRGEYEATVSISGNGDDKLEADQVITLGDLSMYAGEDALVTIENNVANTITLGAVDMVSCEEDTSFRVANNSGLDYEEGMSASVDWSTLNSGAIAMDAGDEASLAIEGNTWAKVELATGEDEGIDISARNDIEFKVKDNTNVNVAMGGVTLNSADRISASVSGNVTDSEDLYLSSVSIGDFSATANDDVNLWMKDNVVVDISLGDVAMTSYTDDVRLYIKDNQDTQFSLGSVALSALDDAALVIRSNVAGEDEGPGLQMLVDGDITIASQEDDATLSFKGNSGVQFGVMGDVSLKAADDVRFELSDNKATLVFMPGSAEGEDSEASPAIKLESTDGDVRLYIKDNGGEDSQDSFNGFAAVLGAVDIDAKDEAKVKINGNENSLIAVGLPASAVTEGVEGVFSGLAGQILENMDGIQQALSSAGPGIEVDATSIDFEIENNFTSGEDFQDDFNVVLLGSTALTAKDTNDVDAHADARMSILGNEQTIIVAGDLQMSADATSSGEDAYAETGLYIGETGFFGASGSNGVQGNETVAIVMGDVSLESNATTVFDEATGLAYVELSANENVRIKLGDVSSSASATSTYGAAYAGAGVAVLGNIGGEDIGGEDDSWIEMGDVTITANTNPIGEDEFTPMSVPMTISEARAAFVLMENEELHVKVGDVDVSAAATGGEDSEAVAVFHLDENTDSSFEFGDVSLSADAKTGFDFAGFSIVDQSNVDVSAGDIRVQTTGARGLAGVAVGAYSNQGYSYLTGTNQGVDYFSVGLQYTPAATDANYETDVALGNIAVSAGNDAAVLLSADSHGSLAVGNIHVTSATAEGAVSGNIFFYMNDVTLNSAVGEDAADHLGNALAAVEAANIAVQDAGSDDVALALAQEALETAEAEVEATEAFLNALEDGISIVLDGSNGADADNTVYATLIDTPDVHSLVISGADANVFLEGEMDDFATLDLSGVTDFAYVETWGADFSNGSDELKLSDHIVVKIGTGDLQYNAMYGVRDEQGIGRGFTGSLVQDAGTNGNFHGDWNGSSSGWYSLGESGDNYLAPTPHEIYIETWGAPSSTENQDVYKFTVDGTSYSVAIEKYISGEDTHGEDIFSYRMDDFHIGLSDTDVGLEAFEESLGVASFEWNGVDRFILTGPSDGSALKPVTTATMVVDNNDTVNQPMEVENIPGKVATDGIGNAVQEVFQFVGDEIGDVVIGGFFAKPVGADNVDGTLRWGDRLDFSQFDLNGDASGMGGANDLTISVVNDDQGYFSDVLITFNTAGMEDSSILLVGVGDQYSTSTDVITNVTNSIIFA